MVDDRTVSTFEKLKDFGVNPIFSVFTNFMEIQGFYKKFQSISRIQGAKINYRFFKGFKENEISLVLFNFHKAMKIEWGWEEDFFSKHF